MTPTLRPLNPINPLDQFRLLWWILLRPDKLIPYRAEPLGDSTTRTGAWLVSTLASLLVFIPALANVFGMAPTPAKVPVGSVQLTCACIAISWVCVGWHYSSKRLDSSEQDWAARLWHFVLDGIGAGGLILGMVVYFMFAISSNWVIAILLTVAYFTAIVMASGIGGVITPGGYGAITPAFMEVFGTVFLLLRLFINESRHMDQVLGSTWATVIFFFVGLFVVVGIVTQGIGRIYDGIVQALKATQRPKTFNVLVAAFALSYIMVVWIFLLGGFKLLSR
jgi:hypothetical protein